MPLSRAATAIADDALDGDRIARTPTSIQGWGGGGRTPVTLVRARAADELDAALAGLRASPGAGAVARGMGRSYGDAAQLTGGLVLDTTALKHFDVDPIGGTVTAEAGVTIGELLNVVVPAGWMLPVVPGTQHVTVAGAIAADIHGKNHGSAGTFGTHVEALGLLTSGGELLELEPGRDRERFWATIGGMGLTGVILWARIRLNAVSGALLSVDTDRVADLDGALSALAAPGGEYRVAWLDLLGARPGRGIVTRSRHVDLPAGAATARARSTVVARARVPARWPGGVLRPTTVRAFNELRFRIAPRRERGRLEAIGAHMFPLDALDAWPRLYGRKGLVQYQLVVPEGEEHVLRLVLEGLNRSRVPCYLAVLKDFGAANDAPLSFPLRGWTLALDLPRGARDLCRLLDGFDELVAGVGGRVYLAKDSRVRPATLVAMYPRLGEWRRVRDELDPDGLWRSDLGVRTGLIPSPRL
jgi:decaprenylphospho-beta-D-ribofuranose 2-oxidase